MDRRELLQDPEESLRIAQDGKQTGLHTAFPGIIQSINFDQQTVVVQPSVQGKIKITSLSGAVTYQDVNLPLLGDVPLFFPRGGDYAITFPVQVGDECLIILAERCIDSWWASGKIGPQIEFRMHDLSDGFAIVGFSSLPNVIPSISTDSLQIKKLDGSTFVELSTSGVTITTDQDLAINTTGDINATVGGDLTATVTGDATVIANNITLTATSNLDLNSDVINLTCNVLNIDAGVINYL